MAAQVTSVSSGALVRIGWLTLCLGLAASVLAAVGVPRHAGIGHAVGTTLVWINYGWLEHGVTILAGVSATQHEVTKVRVPISVYVKAAGRYALIGLVAYVIVNFFAVPVWSVLAGLLSLGAAAIVEVIYEVAVRPH